MAEEYDSENNKATSEEDLEGTHSKQFSKLCKFFAYGAYCNHQVSDNALAVVRDAQEDRRKYNQS